jgi:hypothetical protein
MRGNPTYAVGIFLMVLFFFGMNELFYEQGAPFPNIGCMIQDLMPGNSCDWYW